MEVFVLEKSSLKSDMESFNVWFYPHYRGKGDFIHGLPIRSLESYFYPYQFPVFGSRKKEGKLSKNFPIVQVIHHKLMPSEESIIFIEQDEQLIFDRTYLFALRYAKLQASNVDGLVVNHGYAENFERELLKPPFEFMPTREEVGLLSSKDLLKLEKYLL